MAIHLRRRQFRLAAVGAAILAVGLLGWCLYTPPALYRVTILPSLDGSWMEAFALNDRGQVVVMEHASDHILLWDRDNGIRDLGFERFWPLTINNAGQMSGVTEPLGNVRQISGVIQSPTGQIITMTVVAAKEAIFWEPGSGMMRLGGLDSTTSDARGMNNLGQVIGVSPSDSSLDKASGFLWDKAAGMTQLTTPDGRPCHPMSINDAGQILVVSVDPPGHWFLLDPNGSKSLDAVLSNAQPRDARINANAWMAGVDESNLSHCRLLVWDERGHVKCRVPVGYPHLTRLNDRNQIAYMDVGHDPWARLPFRLPFRLPHHRSPYMSVSYLWDPVRGRIPLYRHLRGMRDFEVVDLNNNGCILGTAKMEDGIKRPVLLEPIPERWSR